MSLLATTVVGKSLEGLRIVIAGQEKLGKTTLVAGAPNPILVPLEIGYSAIDIPRTDMVQEFSVVMAFLDECIAQCAAQQFPYKSIIFDSATALERHCHGDVLKADPKWGLGNKNAVTMESALGGYGKGYTFANAMFDDFLKKCDYLAVYYGINIILTCHVFAAKLIDPTSGEYDSWDLQLHSPKNQKTYGKREMITQWADIIGFLYEPMYISKGTGETLVKGVSSQKGRMLGVTRTPNYVAGNRYGMLEEIAIPLENGWNHLAQSLYNASGLDIYKR